MKNKLLQNLNTYREITELTPSDTTTPLGKCITTFEIHRRRDVTNLDSLIGYTVLMNQRFIIPPKSPYTCGANNTNSFQSYPALLKNEITFGSNTNDSTNTILEDIFPRTINTAVSTSSNDSEGNSTSNTTESTTGSSMTNVNTFSVGANLGFMGDQPTGGISVDYSHSWEESKSHSKSKASTNSDETNKTNAASMSIKDWSAYSYLDDTAINPTWVWAQSYPWDVIQYNYDAGNSTIVLPDFIQDRMLVDGLVLPPSELSMFGLDFSMQASWTIDYQDGITQDETIDITSQFWFYTATHQSNDDGATLTASLDSDQKAEQMNVDFGSLDLSLYALNPIHPTSGSTGAYIGFEANPFTYAPTDESGTFKVVSPANNLQVKGQGFDADISTDLKEDTSITINFKVLDVTINYSLIFMHWISQDSGTVQLDWTVNDEFTGSMVVSDEKGEGGKNNLSEFDLRNTDFTSINFHDYLQLGLNEVVIKFSAVDAETDVNYTLFALGLDSPASSA